MKRPTRAGDAKQRQRRAPKPKAWCTASKCATQHVDVAEEDGAAAEEEDDADERGKVGGEDDNDNDDDDGESHAAAEEACAIGETDELSATEPGDMVAFVMCVSRCNDAAGDIPSLSRSGLSSAFVADMSTSSASGAEPGDRIIADCRDERECDEDAATAEESDDIVDGVTAAATGESHRSITSAKEEDENEAKIDT